LRGNVRRLSEWFDRVSSGWLALAATVVFVLFVSFVLPAQSQVQSSRGAEGIRSPDLSLVYSPATLYKTAEAYGPDGRTAYVRARGTFDVLWPLVYTVFLAVVLSWVARRLSGTKSWRRANLVPIAAGAFDLLENVCTSIVMLRYPARTPVVDLLAPVFTVLKWSFLTVAFVLALVGVVIVAWQAIATRPGTQG
jgi:hypothetical protein